MFQNLYGRGVPNIAPKKKLMVAPGRQNKGSTKKLATKKPTTKKLATMKPTADTAGVVLLTHNGSHLVMSKDQHGLLSDFSVPVPRDTLAKVAAMQALETFIGLTMDQLGGEEEALIGSTFLEAPGRPTRELFVVKLTAELQIPDESYLLDVGANPIWVYKDQLIQELHYAKGKVVSRRGLIGLQGLIGRVKSLYERS